LAIPTYAYLQLKIPERVGVITVEAKKQWALDYELAAIVVAATELRELSPRVPSAPLSLAMPPTSGVFKVAKDTKVGQIDAGDPTTNVQIRASLDPK
jgi:hypothetical protein